MPGRPSAGEGKRRGPALFKTTECTHRWSAERKLADGSTVRVCEKCKAIEFLERWKDATSPGKVKKTRSGAKKGKSVGVSQPTSASKSGAKRGERISKSIAQNLGRHQDSMAALARRELGHSAATAAEWRAAGFTVAEGGKWIKVGLDPYLARFWASAGIAPAEAAIWMRERISAGDAERLRSAEVTPKEGAEWRAMGFSANALLVWRSYGLLPDEARRWKLAGVSPEDAAAGKRTGRHAPSARRGPQGGGAENWRHFK